ncbi:MAG TPA: hypothetical protein DCP90_05205 [Clostridiales bacterium]|nr:MAG: hypothetical protein A2Y22_09000 [Clostridiales bacterium GWD2_32_59]HAN09997.1 hypothetical protein [Clostridiales bacterium]
MGVKKNDKKGFTLLELLAVLVILAALATIAIPIFMNKSETAKQIAHNANVTTLQTQAQAYLWQEEIAMPQANIIEDMATKGYIKEVPTNPLPAGHPQAGPYVVAVSASGVATVTPIVVEVTGVASGGGEPEPPVVADVAVGKYIKFGKYNDADIVWRVINKVDQAYLDANPGSGLHVGDLMLFSDKIISIKAFDATGEENIAGAGGDADRGLYGSNYWDKSNLKAWLNSSANANLVDWLEYISPDATHLLNAPSGYNPYNIEKGFLAEGNFDGEERSKIMPVTHKTILATTDAVAKTGGTEEHGYWTTNPRYALDNNGAATGVNDYNMARYKDTTESVFLLGIKELNDYVYSNVVLGTLEEREAWTKAYPTGQAVTQSATGGYTNAGLNTGAYWYYWLRDSYAPGSCHVRLVSEVGTVDVSVAYIGYRGVRPALFLSPSGMTLDGASGASVGEANTITWE